MKRKMIAALMIVTIMSAMLSAGYALTWRDYSEEIYESAKAVTGMLKEKYDKGTTLTNSEVETLYRMYKLQRSAKEVSYFAKTGFTTIVTSTGGDATAELDKVFADSWKDYLDGKLSKAEFLDIFFTMYIE